MSRLEFFLFVFFIACALGAVKANYQQRRVFIAFEREHTQERRLLQETSRLEYEQSALAKTTRVENIAQHQLKMMAITPEHTQYLNTHFSSSLKQSVKVKASQ